MLCTSGPDGTAFMGSVAVEGTAFNDGVRRSKSGKGGDCPTARSITSRVPSHIISESAVANCQPVANDANLGVFSKAMCIAINATTHMQLIVSNCDDRRDLRNQLFAIFPDSDIERQTVSFELCRFSHMKHYVIYSDRLRWILSQPFTGVVGNCTTKYSIGAPYAPYARFSTKELPTILTEPLLL